MKQNKEQLKAATLFRLQRKRHWPFAWFAIYSVFFAAYALLIGIGRRQVRLDYERACDNLKKVIKPHPPTHENALAVWNEAVSRMKSFEEVTGIRQIQTTEERKKLLKLTKAASSNYDILHSIRFREYAYLFKGLHAYPTECYFDWDNPELYVDGSPFDKWLSANQEFFELAKQAASTPHATSNIGLFLYWECFKWPPRLLRARLKWDLAHGRSSAINEFAAFYINLSEKAWSAGGSKSNGLVAIHFENEISWFLSHLTSIDTASLTIQELYKLQKLLDKLEPIPIKDKQATYFENGALVSHVDMFQLDRIKQIKQLSPFWQSPFILYLTEREVYPCAKENSRKLLIDTTVDTIGRESHIRRHSWREDTLYASNFFHTISFDRLLGYLSSYYPRLLFQRVFNRTAVSCLIYKMRHNKWPVSISDLDDQSLHKLAGNIKLTQKSEKLWITWNAKGKSFDLQRIAYVLPEPGGSR